MLDKLLGLFKPKLKKQQPPRTTCPICELPIDTPYAHWLGEWEGWHVLWDCINECGNELEMDWPFPDKMLVTSLDFEKAGFVIS